MLPVKKDCAERRSGSGTPLSLTFPDGERERGRIASLMVDGLQTGTMNIAQVICIDVCDPLAAKRHSYPFLQFFTMTVYVFIKKSGS